MATACLLGLMAVTAAGAPPREADRRDDSRARLSKLVEANVVATHAYQVTLAKTSGKGDAACFSPGKLTDADLSALVEHQQRLLKGDLPAVVAWAKGRASRWSRAAAAICRRPRRRRPPRTKASEVSHGRD